MGLDFGVIHSGMIVGARGEDGGDKGGSASRDWNCELAEGRAVFGLIWVLG